MPPKKKPTKKLTPAQKVIKHCVSPMQQKEYKELRAKGMDHKEAFSKASKKAWAEHKKSGHKCPADKK